MILIAITLYIIEKSLTIFLLLNLLNWILTEILKYDDSLNGTDHHFFSLFFNLPCVPFSLNYVFRRSKMNIFIFEIDQNIYSGAYKSFIYEKTEFKPLFLDK